MPLRLIILVLLFGFAVFLATHTILKSRKRVDRSRIVALVVLGLVIGQQGWWEYQWFKQEAVLSTAAKSIGGAEADVDCQRFGEALLFTRSNLGEVQFGDDGKPAKQTMIAWEVCKDFRDFLTGDKANPTHEQTVAIHVLTHEAVHMAGEKNEAATECYAMQLMPYVAQSLGVPQGKADEMSAWYLAEVYPTLDNDYYDPGKCYSGGPLDIDPSDEMWPRANVPAGIPAPGQPAF